MVSAVVVVVDESRNLRSFNGYDEPEILPSSTPPFCLIGADVGQWIPCSLAVQPPIGRLQFHNQGTEWTADASGLPAKCAGNPTAYGEPAA
jgi:hypothetical protein